MLLAILLGLAWINFIQVLSFLPIYFGVMHHSMELYRLDHPIMYYSRLILFALTSASLQVLGALYIWKKCE